ncbi:L-lysine 6-monooxygenase (NADPH-requiring)-domain-containing protein [Phyllosticta capitalensis]
MSPHADTPVSRTGSPDQAAPPQNNNQPLRSVHRAIQPKMHKNTSYLKPTPENELHDLVCVGMGPASLAIAVALNDAIENGQVDHVPKVAFLEKQPQFAWHAGMLLDGARMQITFLKDMATFRNPRSHFTFLNYLFQNGRLVDFTNLSTFLPARVEYEDYMKWCASHFNDVTSYGQEVVQVVPEKTTVDSKAIDSFVVTSRNPVTGETSTRRARHVVIATGGQAKIPEPFPQNHPRVIHSSAYKYTVPKTLTDRNAPYTIAVIGAGQSAAEIYEDLQKHYPNARTNLLIRGQHLRPSDDSPFVNEIFNPERVEDMWTRDPVLRNKTILEDKQTNYGVVRLELLERLFETLYLQKMKYESEDDWPHKILNFRDVSAVEESPVKPAGVRLVIQNRGGDYFANLRGQPTEEILDVDLVIIAAGYVRNAHERILAGSKWLMPGGGADDKAKWVIDRNYKVQTEPGKVAPEAGLWLQGCNEMTHGLSDTLLSILAIRGHEVVESIFGNGTPANTAKAVPVNVNGHAEGIAQQL